MTKFIELFAGIGGLGLTFRELGYKCVFSSEIDKHAKKSYQAIYNETTSDDIRDIHARDIPDFDVLLAGFPCQPFSSAGKKDGFLDTRGTLFFEIERILAYHKPKSFLLENVKGLVNHDSGKTLKTILESLRFLGYNVTYKVLDAKNFGLPQHRERVYIVGLLNNNNNFTFPIETKELTKVSDILDDIVDEKYTLSTKAFDGHKSRKIKHLLNGNGFGYSLVSKNDQYTNTITARYYKDGSEILIEQENNLPRKLTPLEAFRLQGFSDEFYYKCKKANISDTQLYKLIGNSVAVNVVRAISRELIKHL